MTAQQNDLMQQKIDELLEATHGGNLLTDTDLKMISRYKNCSESVKPMYAGYILGLYHRHVKEGIKNHDR